MKRTAILVVMLVTLHASAVFAIPLERIKACEQGDAVWCHKLGLWYEYGLGAPKSMRKAAKYYRKACNGGISTSCLNLAYMYEKGIGVRKDAIQAIKLRTMTCDLGDPQGCVYLGSNYSLGKGVPMDKAKAAELLEKACFGWKVTNCGDIMSALRSEGDDRIDYSQAIRLVYQGVYQGRRSWRGPEGCFKDEGKKNPAVNAP